jgi:hypothetical protein
MVHPSRLFHDTMKEFSPGASPTVYHQQLRDVPPLARFRTGPDGIPRSPILPRLANLLHDKGDSGFLAGFIETDNEPEPQYGFYKYILL